MIEKYFGLIEGAFVFSLAIAFYFWQRHSLKRDIAARMERERLAADEKATGMSHKGKVGKP